jgi:hypoxanthine phosphoribosyltransferase
MKDFLLKSSVQIQNSIEELTKQINAKFVNDKIELITLNLAPKYFIKDILRSLKVPAKLHSIAFEHYSESNESGEVNITKDLTSPIFDKHVILLDGIIISGITHFYISNCLKQRMPKSLSIACVGIKEDSLKKELPYCYSLFNFKDEWVEGYGIGSEPSKSLPYLINSKNDL